MILFSIIIPTYNRAAFLSPAIDSVLAQTYPNWELLIVDDGSTDNTKDVVLSYSDKRTIYLYQQNCERSAARNNGIAHAKGDFICFMDSDEYLDKTHLEILYNNIEKNNLKVAAYYTDIKFEFSNTKFNYVRKGKVFSFPVNKDELIKMIIGTPQLCCSHEILKKHQFNPALSIGEDMELLFRITDEYPLIYLENNATITEVEHEYRSVGCKSKASKKQLKTLSTMFSKGHPAYEVSRTNKKWLKSEVLFNAAYDYLLCGNLKGFMYLIRSLLEYPKSSKTKYKFNILIAFLLHQKSKIQFLLQQN